jgi:hypothetical protein
MRQKSEKRRRPHGRLITRKASSEDFLTINQGLGVSANCALSVLVAGPGDRRHWHRHRHRCCQQLQPQRPLWLSGAHLRCYAATCCRREGGVKRCPHRPPSRHRASRATHVARRARHHAPRAPCLLHRALGDPLPQPVRCRTGWSLGPASAACPRRCSRGAAPGTPSRPGASRAKAKAEGRAESEFEFEFLESEFGSGSGSGGEGEGGRRITPARSGP